MGGVKPGTSVGSHVDILFFCRWLAGVCTRESQGRGVFLEVSSGSWKVKGIWRAADVAAKAPWEKIEARHPQR